MNILLDTTIQIDRIFKPSDREKIKKLLRENECYCSTFVLGEYNSNVVNDFVTLYSIMQIEDNLTDVYQRIADVYSNRSKTRMIYLVNDLVRDFDNDFDLIKEQLEIYPERLRERFYYGINKELLDETQCAKAKAEVEMQGNNMRMKGINCRKTDCQCNIENFWKKYKNRIEEMKDDEAIPGKMRPILKELVQDNIVPKGNHCRSMGDCIICLEALGLEDGSVASTNQKDFLPICKHIGVCLKSIEK